MPVSTLKTIITDKCGSEASMARRLGWTRQRLNKITSGAKTPNVDEISIIAKGLGMSISKVANFFLPQ